MRRGFYMHENAMDVAIEVTRVQYEDSKRIKFRGKYWNLGYSGTPWLIFHQDFALEINKADLPKWICINSKMTTKRMKSGLPA